MKLRENLAEACRLNGGMYDFHTGSSLLQRQEASSQLLGV